MAQLSECFFTVGGGARREGPNFFRKREVGARNFVNRHLMNSNGMNSSPELIQGLNEDLAAEWGTIMRYTFQSAKATGLRGAELREILEKEIPDELGHARYLTDVIADLGGDPTMEPR